MRFRTGCTDFNINHKIECIGCVVCFKLIRCRTGRQGASSAKTAPAHMQAFYCTIHLNPIGIICKILIIIFPEHTAFKIHAKLWKDHFYKDVGISACSLIQYFIKCAGARAWLTVFQSIWIDSFNIIATSLNCRYYNFRPKDKCRSE